MRFEVSAIGKEIQALQKQLAEEYGYKKQPDDVAEVSMQRYIDTLPEDFRGEVKRVDGIKPGFEVAGKDIPLYSKDGTQIATGYDRIVIGHYGAFIEISPEKMCMDNIKCEAGQEYRINNPEFASRIKYRWMTTRDDSHCKLYDQLKGVVYADYRAGVWYADPFEVCDALERAELGVAAVNTEEDEITLEQKTAYYEETFNLTHEGAGVLAKESRENAFRVENIFKSPSEVAKWYIDNNVGELDTFVENALDYDKMGKELARCMDDIIDLGPGHGLVEVSEDDRWDLVIDMDEDKEI